MSNEIITLLTIYGVTTFFLTVVLIGLVFSEPPEDASTGWIALGLILIWPLAGLGVLLWLAKVKVSKIFQNRDSLRRRLKAIYWEWRARKEEEDAEKPQDIRPTSSEE